MTIFREKKLHKGRLKVGFIILVLFLLASGAIVWNFLQRPKSSDISQVPQSRPENTVDYSKPSDSAQSDNQQMKENIIKDDDNKQALPQEYSLTISRLSQQPDKPMINIRSILEGSPVGTCHLTLAQDQKTISQSYQVSQQANYTTCNIDITLDDIPSSGTWRVSLYADTVNAKSNTTTGSVEVIK